MRTHLNLSSILAKLSPTQNLCWACSCVERWLPTLKLVSLDDWRWMDTLLNEYWNACEANLIPKVSSVNEERLAGSMERLLDDETTIFDFAPQIFSNAVGTLLSTTRYLTRLETSYVILCGDQARDAGYQLAHNIIGTYIYPSDTVLVEHVTEVHQQELDLNRISGTPFHLPIITEIRIGSQILGQNNLKVMDSFGNALAHGNIDVNRGFPFLIKALNDINEVTRREAIVKLLTLRDPRSIQPLIDILTTTNDLNLAEAIIFGLGLWKETQAIESLTKMLNHDSVKLRRAASVALRNISGP